MRRIRTPLFFLGGASFLICLSAPHGRAEGLTTPPLLEPTFAEPPAAPAAPAAPLDTTAKPNLTTPGGLPRLGSAPRSQPAPSIDPTVTNQTRRALDFYGGSSARATLSRLPRRTPIQASPPRPMQAQLKPFNAVQSDPTISPYLNLDRPETAEDLPNYFAFVRPQFQQMDTNRGQQRDLNRMQRQLNSVTATVVNPQQSRVKLPGTGTPSRFMDTAQFYGGWRR